MYVSDYYISNIGILYRKHRYIQIVKFVPIVSISRKIKYRVNEAEIPKVISGVHVDY